MPEPSSPQYRDFQRRNGARTHLDLTVRSLDSKIEVPLRVLAAACRATAFTEGDEARVAELSDVADRVLEKIDEINDLAGRAWATTRHDWAPPADTEIGA